MYRLFVKWRAKRRYVWKEEFEAGIAELSAKAALYRAQEGKTALAKMTKEADDLDARITEVTAMQEKGYWECENGHEIRTDCGCAQSGDLAIVHTNDCVLNGFSGEACPCPNCGKPMKFIKRSTMTPQEQYESDKERKEAEKIAGQKRAEIAEQQKEAENQENTAKVFMNQAERGRAFADLLRKL